MTVHHAEYKPADLV